MKYFEINGDNIVKERVRNWTKLPSFVPRHTFPAHIVHFFWNSYKAAPVLETCQHIPVSKRSQN